MIRQFIRRFIIVIGSVLLIYIVLSLIFQVSLARNIDRMRHTVDKAYNTIKNFEIDRSTNEVFISEEVAEVFYNIEKKYGKVKKFNIEEVYASPLGMIGGATVITERSSVVLTEEIQISGYKITGVQYKVN